MLQNSLKDKEEVITTQETKLTDLTTQVKLLELKVKEAEADNNALKERYNLTKTKSQISTSSNLSLRVQARRRVSRSGMGIAC